MGWIQKFRSKNPEVSQWEIESFLNHHHFNWDFDTSPDTIDEAIVFIDHLSMALRDCYPATPFTISMKLGHVVSFWRTSPTSPKEEYPWIAPPNTEGVIWCVKCQEHVRYGPSDFFDRRFEKAEWGTCPKCGALLLVRSCENLIFINNSHLRRG